MTIKLYKFRKENKYFYGNWADLTKICHDNTSGWKTVKGYKRKLEHLISKFHTDKFFVIDGVFIKSWPQTEPVIEISPKTNTWVKSKVSAPLSSEVDSMGSSTSTSSSTSLNQYYPKISDILNDIQSITLSTKEIASIMSVLTQKLIDL